MTLPAGYVQIYTGDGKGKTTAALGLTFRAMGAGHQVFWGQFLKQGNYSEIKMLNRFADQVTVRQFGSGEFVTGKPTTKEIEKASLGLEICSGELVSGLYDLVVLDEIIVAVSIGILSEENLLALISSRPPNTELVLTGRGATDNMMDMADLVSHIQCMAHYYDAGVMARKGIER